jgi:hypothetical protein
MSEKIAYCGLICQGCPIYIATREVDKSKKEKMIHEIIHLCKEHYNINYKYSDINDCDGCISGSERLFTGCANCKIRKCAIERDIENCAYCENYVCELLKEAFKTDPDAKIRLDVIRNKYKKHHN